MKHFVRIVLALLCICFGAGFIFFGLKIPITLDVSLVPDTIYSGDKLSKKDIRVQAKTLFGVKSDVDNFSYEIADGNVHIDVVSGNLKGVLRPHPIQAETLSAVYNGNLYVGQKIDKSLLAVTVTYEDGTVKDMKDFSVDKAVVPNVKDEFSFVVYTFVGDTTVTVPVVVPDKMEASYEGVALAGTLFNRHNVNVVLHYTDDSVYRIRDFVVNDTDADGDTKLRYEDLRKDASLRSYPSVLQDDVTLYAISPYGTTAFDIHPLQVNTLSASYNGTLYEGDVLSSSDVKVLVQLQDEPEQVVDTFSITNTGPFKMETLVDVETVYGDVQMTVKPILIKNIRVDVGNEVIGGYPAQVNSIRLIYEDDTERDLDLSEVEFLNKPSVWKDGEQIIWFRYHGGEYRFRVTAVPSSVASLRTKDGGVSTQMQTYDISDDDINTLALIAQRVGNKSVSVTSDEIAVMANRYELYGGGAAGDGSALVSYVKNSGYWGSADTIENSIADSTVNEDVEFVVRDSLVNGYRTLPKYVTERITVADVVNTNTSSYERDNTVITTRGGYTLRFYFMEPDDTSLLYCYSEESYQAVTGQAAPVPMVVAPSAAVNTLPDDSSIVIESVEDNPLDYEIPSVDDSSWDDGSSDILEDGSATDLIEDDVLFSDW